MTESAREAARVRNPVLLISGAAWILLAPAPGGMEMHAHHHSMPAGDMSGLETFRMMLAMNPVGQLAAAWLLMLAAMMLPVLIPALCHIHRRSLAKRRLRSSALFIAGYTGVWMAAGCLLTAAGLALGAVAPGSYLPAAGVLAIALIWQASPVKQVCLNRCHRHTSLSAFGAAADLDAVRFGGSHGVWCAGSCWALMLVPMLLPGGHLIAMAAVAGLIFSERLEEPAPSGWGWRGAGRLIRMLRAQTRIRLRSLARLEINPSPVRQMPHG